MALRTYDVNDFVKTDTTIVLHLLRTQSNTRQYKGPSNKLTRKHQQCVECHNSVPGFATPQNRTLNGNSRYL